MVTSYLGVKCKVDNPLDAVNAEDAVPGGNTVVPERAPRRAKRAAADADGAREKAAQDARGARVSGGFFPRAVRVFRGALCAPRSASWHDRRPPGPGILCIHCIQWIIHFAFHPWILGTFNVY